MIVGAICNYIKEKADSLLSEFIFRFRVFSCNGKIGRSLFVSNQRYIKVGDFLKLKSNYRIECYDSFYGDSLSPNFVIGDRVTIGYNLTAFVADNLYIGDDTILAGGVTLITENHGMDPMNSKPYHSQPLKTGPIEIGKACWIGQNVCILPNVKIGDKCIVAAGAVVNSDIPEYSIAVGVPARVVKKYNFDSCKWEKA